MTAVEKDVATEPEAVPPPRGRFQSDHAFDAFISPVSNPFYFQDPRALTEIKPLLIYQHVPQTNAFQSGNIWYAGLQGRVALTDRLSFAFTKLGWTWLDATSPVLGTRSNDGFSELQLRQ